jgi:prepilin peptidase CpaA
VDGWVSVELGRPRWPGKEGNVSLLRESNMAQVPTAVVWLVSAILVEAAVIDGKQLRVPNWLTYHLVVGGLLFSTWMGGREALLWSLAGAGVGLVSLLPLYAIGGMGAGDVKLMAGVGAWMGPSLTLGAFVASALAGGVIALGMVLASGELVRHWGLFQLIGFEILSVRNPTELAQRAGERKPTMILLPYAIPIALGSIAYFAWMGLYF